MSNIVTIGLATEGTTDIRFLQSVIQRTFEHIAFECKGEIEVYDPVYLGPTKGQFVESVENLARKAAEQGIMVLCIHADADESSDQKVWDHKFYPAFQQIENSETDLCKNLIPIIPIQMTEAWMLADREVLLSEIGTDQLPQNLGLHRDPESISDPKFVISEAIRIAFADLPKRRRNQITIADLYQPIGQKARMDRLERLESFQKFKSVVREAYRKLNYLHK